VQLHADVLTFTLGLPAELHRVEFGLPRRHDCIDVTLDHDRIRLAPQPCTAEPVRVQVGDLRATLDGGRTREFDITQRVPSPPALLPARGGH
jgi:hypothetical protein